MDTTGFLLSRGIYHHRPVSHAENVGSDDHVFWCVFGLFFIAPWIFRVGISGLVTQRPILLFSSGINTLLGLSGVFAAVSLIPVADVVNIMYSKPNFASIAAFLILR